MSIVKTHPRRKGVPVNKTGASGEEVLHTFSGTHSYASSLASLSNSSEKGLPLLSCSSVDGLPLVFLRQHLIMRIEVMKPVS